LEAGSAQIVNIQDSLPSWCSAFRLLQRFLSGFSFQNAEDGQWLFVPRYARVKDYGAERQLRPTTTMTKN